VRRANQDRDSILALLIGAVKGAAKAKRTGKKRA
jgi:hypothetical protein